MKLDKTDIKLIVLALVIVAALIGCFVYAHNYVATPKPQPTIATAEDLEIYVKNIGDYYSAEDLIRV